MFKLLWFLFFSFLFSQMIALGQAITTDVPQLNFGIVLETEPQSLPLTISNESEEVINILDIQFFDTHGDPAFFSNTLSFALEPSESRTIEITFAPIHNIAHNTEMFIVTQHRGAIPVDLIGQGRYSNNYYLPTENLENDSLHNSLTLIIASGTVDLGYNGARDEMFMEVDNQNVNGLEAEVNTLEGIYTGQIITDYNSRQEAQGAGFNFNTEHTWPQSKGAGDSPMKSDLFHIFPTNANANTRRGSMKFGIVEEPIWESGGSKQGNTASDLFEPRDVQKGATARAMFYFATRYKNQTGVELNWLASQESILREWNFNFPPTEVEENRNEAIYVVQNNRNPFIDYPQFIDRIDSFTGVEETSEPEYSLINDVIDFGYIDSDGTYSFAFPIYNVGELPIDFSNFEFIGTDDISIDFPSDSTITIQPGEDFSLLLTFVADDDQGDWGQLQFEQESDEIETETIEVPVFANIAVGIAQAKLAESISLYPNPARNVLNIVVGDEFNTKKDLKIYNTSGQSMFEAVSLLGSQQQLPLDEFKNGIYWIQIECLGQSVIKPFVIQK